jgi:hypothetical protein
MSELIASPAIFHISDEPSAAVALTSAVRCGLGYPRRVTTPSISSNFLLTKGDTEWCAETSLATPIIKPMEATTLSQFMRGLLWLLIVDRQQVTRGNYQYRHRIELQYKQNTRFG